MKFSVGYKVMAGDPDSFSDIVRDYRDSIGEVYFAWPGEPSGRSPLDPGSVSQVATELEGMKRSGLRLNLLMNAACYGDQALTCALAEHVTALVGHLRDNMGLDTVTTVSPLVARTVRRHFPEIDVRASVNLRLGTVKAMQYVAHLFTSYCIQREYNRDFERMEELQAWAHGNGKRLHVLANSACLNFCSLQTFHDNAVAHETAINCQRNVENLTTLCREYYTQKDHWVNFLQGSWIRPEDIARHARIFHGGYKLATRMHDNPRLVIAAYARGRHVGNLLDLLEPGFGPLFYPYIIANAGMPDNWFETTVKCGKRCGACKYCAQVLAAVLLPIEIIHLPNGDRLGLNGVKSGLKKGNSCFNNGSPHRSYSKNIRYASSDG